jgi:hypothetical protein
MYRAELSLDGETYGVITCEYVLSQKTDDMGRPEGMVRSGLIEIVVLGTDEEILAHWAADSAKQMDGTLTFYLLNEDTVFKEVKFEGGYCITYREYFLPLGNQTTAIRSPTGLTSYCLEIAISAAKVTVDGMTHDNGWPG